MKIYDKEVYNKQEEIRNVIIIIVSFLVGFMVGYMANTITNNNNTSKNVINNLVPNNTINEVDEGSDNSINEALVQYNIKNLA